MGLIQYNWFPYKKGKFEYTHTQPASVKAKAQVGVMPADQQKPRQRGTDPYPPPPALAGSLDLSRAAPKM